MTKQAITLAQMDFSFVAFALMGALIEPNAAFSMAAEAMVEKGYTAAEIAAARTATENRINQWGRS